VGWLAWRDRRVLALLLATRLTTRLACVGHVASRPTVSQSEYHRGFLSGLLKILVAVVLRTDFLSMHLIILLYMSYFKLKIIVLGVS
jgi:hypothetical protein